MKRFLFAFAILLISAQFSAQSGTPVTNTPAVNNTNNIELEKQPEIIPAKYKETQEETLDVNNENQKLSVKKEVKQQPQSEQQQGMLKGEIAVSKNSNYSRSLSNAERNQLSLNMASKLKDSRTLDGLSTEELKTKFILENYKTEYCNTLINTKATNDLNLNTLKTLSCILLDSTKLLKTELIQLRSSEYLSQSQIDFASDVLASVDQNGILVTHAFSDTYALLYNQKVNGNRADVKLVCLDFLVNSDYSKRINQTTLKIPAVEIRAYAESEKNDIDFKSQLITNVDTSYFLKLIALNTDKTIFIATTVPKEYFKGTKQSLYWSGLTMSTKESYLTEPSNLQFLWETKWNKKSFSNYIPLSKNYLGSMLILEAYYDEINETEKELEIKKEIKMLKKKYSLK